MSLGTRLHTFLHGQPVGQDAAGNRYYQAKTHRPADLRRRRWVLFNGPEEATTIPPEWHAWLHYTVDAPLSDAHRLPWQKPHLPNRTGTALAYRPPGHDYKGGHRPPATGDYQSWTPDAPALPRPQGRLNPMPSHSPLEVATGAVVLLVAGGFLAYAVANTGQKFSSATYPLHATFDHVDGLSPGAEVRIAGVKIGSVDAIRLNPSTYQADVAFSVARNIALTTDSSATISTDGLLGGKYLALATGGEDTKLKPGGAITITQGSVNLESLIGKYIFGSTGSKTPDKPADKPADKGTPALK